MENKKQTVSNVINLPEELHKKCKIEAITKNKTLHDVIVDSIEKGIELISDPTINNVVTHESN